MMLSNFSLENVVLWGGEILVGRFGMVRFGLSMVVRMRSSICVMIEFTLH